jgi:bacteriophage N4 adsorption protein B
MGLAASGLATLDGFVLAILVPLAAMILVSGLDDLFIDLIWGWAWLKVKMLPAERLFPPGPRQLQAAPRAMIAIYVPLWHEDGVIASMLEHNLAAIRYSNYHFFAGCYPNDFPTQDAVQSVADRYPNVHLAVCPHPGPTSKADCLNWAYQNMLLYEEQNGIRFDIVVTHDAEDLIHPEELSWINYYAARYDFVQTPVLALPTPPTEMTHGVYLDEFAEYHMRDMTVRGTLGGFVPSCGVGTGYRREALEKLASSSHNQIFEPTALTEDYDNGLRLKRLGCSQAFVPLAKHGTDDYVATREYFPRNFNAAVRQRTRWVMGISLQGWEKFGWRGTPIELYWLWRDRKGLLANPLSVLANVVFVYGLVTQIWLRASMEAMQLAWVTFALLCMRALVRVGCVYHIYGWKMAIGAPLRAVYANVINSAATYSAVRRYAWAKFRGQPLKWLKTDHTYPDLGVLKAQKRKLGEILVNGGYATQDAIDRALATKPDDVRFGEHLLTQKVLSEATLYQALSFQQGMPFALLNASEIPLHLARSLPKALIDRCRVLPFRVEHSVLCVASPDVPSPETKEEVKDFTSLEVRFHLVPPRDFSEAAAAVL